jgi:glycosyltransferase involved in cell wall biosynthesis
MKIVIATAVYYPQINGVAVFSHNLACGLAERGHEVMVICPSHTGHSYTREVDGVKVCYLKSVNTKVYPDQIHETSGKRRLFYRHGFRVSVFPRREVMELLTNFQPDVVHVQVSDPVGLSVVSWAKKHGVPVVTTEHNQPEVLTDPLHMPRVLKKPANALLYMYFRNRQSKSDFVTMPTKQAIYNLLSRGRELGVPVAAVSNGVDLTRFKPGKASKDIFEKYGITVDAPTVLYVGRVDPEKKVELVIEAFLRADVPGSQLVIVGDGVDKSRLMRRYAGLTNVKFLGRVVGDDLYELYKTGWLFATASEIETQGIVLIEAAACGLPLVAVDAGAVSEVCIDEENGYLCEPGSVSEIAAAIKKILVDDKLRNRFSKKSLEVAKEHDFETTLDKFINIYNKVKQ